MQSNSTLSNTILNTSNSAQVVVYTVTPTASTGSCPGVAQTVSVTVNPSPILTNSNSSTVCSGIGLNTSLTTNVPSTFSWVAANNGNVTGESTTAQTSGTITNTLTSSGASPENVIYSITPTSTSGCAGTVQTITVTVNPAPIMSALSGVSICSGNSFSIPLTANIPSTFSWVAANNASVSGESTTAQSGSTVLNTLTNSGSTSQNIVYTVTPTSSSGSCVGTSVSVTTTVNPSPQITSVNTATICSGNGINLALTSNVNSTFSWISSDNSNTTGESLTAQTSSTITNTITNNSNSTQSLTYTITPTSVNGSCPGTSQTLTASINPNPTMNSASTVSICSGNAVNLSLSSNISSNFSWIAGSNNNVGGESLTAQSSTTINNTLTNSGSSSQQVVYTVTPTSATGSCTGTAQSVTVTVNPIPSASSLSSNSPVCLNGTINLTAPTTAGATYSWNGPGGFSSVNQNSTIPNATSSGTYSLTITANGCSSPMATTSVTVNSIPISANPASNGTICSGQNVLLTSVAIASATYSWTGPGGFTSPSQNPTIVSASTSVSGTYSLTVSVPGCGSTTTETVSVLVNQTPATPTVTGSNSICSGNNLTLSVAGTAGSTFNWSGPNNFSSNGNNVTVNSINSSGAGTYTVNSTLNNCTGPNVTFSVTVITADNPNFNYSSGTYCASGTNPSAQITGTTGGTFSSSSAGLVISNASTGLINLSGSTLGTYTVTYTTSGTCPTSSTFPVTVTAAPSANFSFSGPYCTSGTDPLPTFNTGASAGIFSGSTSGLVFINSTTGEIDLSSSSAGTYTVNNNIASAGGCAAATFSTTIVIDAAPTANSGNTITLCQGALVTLNGSIGGSASSAVWSGGTGTFSNSNSLSTTYTPAAGETSVNLVLTTNDPAGACNSITDTIAINITPLPASPTVITDTVCQGASASLQATAPGGTYQWFIVPTGGTLIGTGANFTTPAIQFNVNFYVQTTVGSCTSPRIAVPVVTLPIPSPPTSSGSAICTGTTTTLTASGGTTYNWYDASSGGNLLGTTSTLTTPILNSNTSYFVENIVNGCKSSRTAVTVTVSAIPAAPTVSNLSVCEGGTVTLSATAPGGNYQWFDAATGGNLLQSGISFTTPAINSATQYFVNTTINGCTGPVSTVTVSTIPTPPAPTASGVTICAGETAQLSATAPGPVYRWYDAPTGGTLLNTGSSFASPTLNSNTNYYVQTTVSGCTSSRSAVTVTVNPIPTAPTVSTATVCEGNGATISAAVSGAANVEWYDANNNGTLLASTASYNTPLLNNSTTYFVKSIENGCSSVFTPCTVSVTPLENSNINYASGSFCISGSNASPIVAAGVTGTFSASPSGLNFVSSNTGVLNVSTSIANTYTVTFTSNGTCPTTSTTTVTITNAFNALFSYNGPYCKNSTNESPQFASGASAGIFTSSPSGLAFVNNSTGEIDFSNSGAGTYLVTNTIAASSGCAAASDTSTVTIFAQPIVDAGNSQIVCEGAVVNLSGLIGGSASSASWTGGNGTYSNSNALNTVYFPAAGETTLTLVLTSDDPTGPCTVQTDTLHVTIQSNPIAPTALDVSTCENTSATLNATALGGTYSWFDVPTGGMALSTGANFVTLPLSNSTVFYAQTQAGNCISPRTPVNVTVIPQDDPGFTYAVGTLCSTGINPLPTVSGVPGGIFSVAPTGLVFINPNTGEVNLGAGNLNSFTVTYVTPGTCPDTANFIFTVTNGFDATFNLNPSYCASASNPSPTFPSGASAGIFTASPAGMIFSNAANGIIDLAATTPGTYTVTNTIPASGLCAAATHTLVINVDPPATADAGLTQSVCKGDSVTLAASFGGSASSGNWTGGNGTILNPGNLNAIYIPTASENSATLFFTTDDPAGSCNAQVDSVVLQFNQDTATFSYGAGTFCNSSLDPTPVIIGNYSGVFTSSPSGLLFTDNTSGQIDLSLSTQNTYTVTFTTNGNCQNTYDQTVSITALTDASFSFNSNYCQNTIAATPVFVNGASAGNFSVTPSGLNFTDILTGEIDLENSSPGTYTVTNTISSSGSCASATYVDTVVIDPAPLVNAGNSTNICQGVNQVTLNGSITLGSTTGVWSTQGSGSFTPDSTNLNATYLFSPADSAAGTVTLLLTSTNNGLCNAVVDSVVINVLSSVSVFAGLDSTICSNETILLNGILNGGNPSVVWTSNGTGTFNPTDSTLQTSYSPSATDILTGQVSFILSPLNTCGNPTDTIVYTINPGPQITASADQNLCNTISSIQLGSTNNGFAGGLIWSVNGNGNFTPSDTVANAVYNAAPSDGDTLYFIVQTTGNGNCSADIDTSIVIRSSAPVVNFSTANRCAGQNIAFNDLSSGTPLSWNWDFGLSGNSDTSSSQNPTFNYSSEGDYNVSLIAATSPGCSDTLTLTVHVNASPVSNFNYVSACANDSVSFADSSFISNGNLVNWHLNFGDGDSSNLIPIKHLYDTVGVFNVVLTVTSDSGCVSTSSKSVEVYSLPIASFASNILCDTTGASFSNTTIGNNLSFNWSFGNGTNQIIENPNVIYADTGNYQITLIVTTQNGCKDTLVDTLEINSPVIASYSPPGGTFDPGEQITLTDLSIGATSIQWSNTAINPASPVVSYTAPGTYELSLIASNAACSDTATFTFEIERPDVLFPTGFTPNGDGKNDYFWVIGGPFSEYELRVFNEWGGLIFMSNTQNNKWDGTNGGSLQPSGTYVYVFIGKTADGREIKKQGEINLIR
ncbi:MAG: PKD-like domain-containing protein [Bacteroidota bacterium]